MKCFNSYHSLIDIIKDFQTNPEFDDMDSDGMMHLREKQIKWDRPAVILVDEEQMQRGDETPWDTRLKMMKTEWIYKTILPTNALFFIKT